MTLSEMLIAMRVELSDAATFHSAGELTRAIQKMVSLVSRLIPNREILETTIGDEITDETVTLPAAASATAIVNAADISATVDGGTLTIADSTPDVPRRLTVTFTDTAPSAITSLAIIVKGYDEEGRYVEERWYLKDLVSGTAKQGDVYFKRVIEVEVDNIAGNGTGDTLSVGTGHAYDSFVYLANRGLLHDNEKVTSSPAGTNYTRDTHYVIDYLKGGIKYINVSGGMAAGGSYLIDYKRDPRIIDINALLPKGSYFKIEKVEHPVGDDPPTYNVPEQYGDFIWVKGRSKSLGADDHARIIYLKPWAAPGEDSPGDYPKHLDDAIIVGSCGQALIFKAEKYVQSAITENALVNGAADNMATPLADINTALDKIAGIVGDAATAGDADTALDAAINEALLGNAALDKIITYLETNSAEDAKSWLTKITTDIAGLRTALLTAVDAANSYLDEVDTTDLGQATYGAEALLKVPISSTLIDALTTGERVPERYRELADGWASIAAVRSNAAIGFVREAEIRLANLRTYIEQAQGWMRIAEGFLGEGAARHDTARVYIEEANGRLGMAGAYVDEATQRVAEVNAYAAQADRYAITARNYMDIAGRYLASGQAKINEMFAMLGNKSEYKMYSSASQQFS